MIKFAGFSWVTTGCENCQSTPSGDALQCGVADAKETSVAFEMNMRVNIVKKGKIEFYYRKDSTKERDGWISGIFSFFMDDVSILDDEDRELDPYRWKHFSFDLMPGLRQLSFVYQKYNSVSNAHMKFELKVRNYERLIFDFLRNYE